MDDSISRQAAIEVIDAVFPVDPRMSEYTRGIACGAALAKTYVEQLPSVEAEPVRHGHWDTVEDWDGDEHYQCSECGAEFVLIDGTPKDNDYLYCPHCGAFMDEVT